MGCSKSLQHGIGADLKEDIRRVEQYTDRLVKCILIGDTNVGKSALMMKMSENQCVEDYVSTIGMDFRLCEVERADDTKFKYQIWDSSGHEKFDTVRRPYLRGYSVIICYSVTDRDSFDHIRSRWKRELDNYASRGNNECMILVGTKYDQFEHRQVTYEEGQTLAQELGDIAFFETSIYGHSKEKKLKHALIVDGYLKQQCHSSNFPEGIDRVVTLCKRYYCLHDDDDDAHFTDIQTIFIKLGQSAYNESTAGSSDDT